MSDYLLRDAVERAILSYAPIRTSETEINIDVRGSEVTLKGYVRTDTMRSVATQMARGVRTGLTVRNQLLSDSDLEIQVAVAIDTKLGNYIVPMMPIVRVIMGHCFVRGPVPSDSAKEMIAQVASRVPGIVRVENELDVDAIAVERMIAPKKAARAVKAAGAGGGQAMVGGKVVTEADLPAWALKPKTSWAMAEYKARAKAKMAFKRNEGPDPKEMETAGTILREGSGVAEPEAVEAEPVVAAVDAAPVVEDTAEEETTTAAPVDMAALQAQYPAWALKPKEEWSPEDFKGQMAAKRAFKQGQGEEPEAIIEKAKAAMAAAQSGGTKKKVSGAKDPKAAALEAVRQQFPGWSLLPRKEWVAKDFQEAADAKVAELNGKGKAVREVRTEAQAALEAAMRGEVVSGGGGAKRRDLTPEEIAAVRSGLAGQYPMWALKAKEEWDQEDFKGQMAAKRAAKSGGGETPDAIIEKAQAALQEALKAAHEALPLEGGDAAPAAASAAPAGKKEIPAALFEKYPGWALKPKEDWTPEEFKAQAKAKSAFKKGDGPDPDAVIAEAQKAIG
jgi:osmotically-inducible protein OsmY